MKILLVSATEAELEPIIKKAQKIQEMDSVLSTYELNGHTFDILCSGVGMVATSYQLGRVLASYNYDCAINAGIAGSFLKDLSLGTVVEVVEDEFSEMGAEDGSQFLSLSDLNLSMGDEYSGSIVNRQKIWDLPYPKLKAITVNTVHGSEERISMIENRLQPQIESMEGAAFLYACKMVNVPCVQIRSISNYVERRNKSNWNIPLAVQNLNAELLKFISK